jgi:chromosomal replication initiation ATPase DnaA
MVEQLLLNLVQPIRYSADTFVVHSGVAEVAASVLVLVCRKAFSLIYVQGERWSGKTHFGAYVTGELHERGLPVRFVDGSDAVSWCQSELKAQPLKISETVIIDDADHFIRSISRSGNMGILLDLIEGLRTLKGSLVLVGTFGPMELGAPAQIATQLNAGLHLKLGSPSDAELGSILDVVCTQRGIRLTAMKKSYVLKRVKDLHSLVECVEKVEGISESSPAKSTSFQVLAEAVGETDGSPDDLSPLKVSGWK